MYIVHTINLHKAYSCIMCFVHTINLHINHVQLYTTSFPLPFLAPLILSSALVGTWFSDPIQSNTHVELCVLPTNVTSVTQPHQSHQPHQLHQPHQPHQNLINLINIINLINLINLITLINLINLININLINLMWAE